MIEEADEARPALIETKDPTEAFQAKRLVRDLAFAILKISDEQERNADALGRLNSDQRTCFTPALSASTIPASRFGRLQAVSASR